MMRSNSMAGSADDSLSKKAARMAILQHRSAARERSEAVASAQSGPEGDLMQGWYVFPSPVLVSSVFLSFSVVLAPFVGPWVLLAFSFCVLGMMSGVVRLQAHESGWVTMRGLWGTTKMICLDEEWVMDDGSLAKPSFVDAYQVICYRHADRALADMEKAAQAKKLEERREKLSALLPPPKGALSISSEDAHGRVSVTDVDEA